MKKTTIIYWVIFTCCFLFGIYIYYVPFLNGGFVSDPIELKRLALNKLKFAVYYLIVCVFFVIFDFIVQFKKLNLYQTTVRLSQSCLLLLVASVLPRIYFANIPLLTQKYIHKYYSYFEVSIGIVLIVAVLSVITFRPKLKEGRFAILLLCIIAMLNTVELLATYIGDFVDLACDETPCEELE